MNKIKIISSAVLQGLIIFGICSAFAAGVRAYGEIEALKVKIQAVDRAIERLNTRLDQLPLCRQR